MKIAVAGFKGRMGGMLVRELESGDWPGLSFHGGTTGMDPPETLFDADAVIDFTTPAATRRHIWLAAKARKPIVIGTTGLTDADMEEMKAAARECPVLYSANMSVGVNLLAVLVERAAGVLGPAYDAEIVETHHRGKVDAPSGTALMLGRATGREAAPIDRSGKRAEGLLGYAVRRGGDIVGDHAVTFFGPGESIEMSHRAGDRSLFAKGALRAVQWLGGKPAGLYSMRDVLAL